MKIGEQLSNDELRQEHIPKQRSPWREIIPFASSFNAYEHFDGTRVPGKLANEKAKNPAQCNLLELRAALFFEYRRYNHLGRNPTDEALVHLHGLLEEIRARVAANGSDQT